MTASPVTFLNTRKIGDRLSSRTEILPKILFYNDSHVFGGHEFMTIKIANELHHLGQYDISFIYFNHTFSKLLNNGIEKTRVSFHTKLPLPFIRNFNIFNILELRVLIKRLKPNIFIVSQGDIEIGLKGLLSGMQCKTKIISYIPMALLFKERQKILGGFRDLVDRIFYKIPHEFITISHYQASLLKRFIDGKEIHVIRLPILSKRIPRLAKSMCRALPKDLVNIGVIGRIEFNQKNQGILIDVSNILKKTPTHFTFHILGDGPDRVRLEKAIEANNLAEHIVLHGWLNRENLFLYIADNI